MSFRPSLFLYSVAGFSRYSFLLTVWPSVVALICTSPSPCLVLGVSLEIERHELGPIVAGCISGMGRQCLQKHGGEQVGGMMPLTRKHNSVEVRAH